MNASSVEENIGNVFGDAGASVKPPTVHHTRVVINGELMTRCVSGVAQDSREVQRCLWSHVHAVANRLADVYDRCKRIVYVVQLDDSNVWLNFSDHPGKGGDQTVTIAKKSQ